MSDFDLGMLVASAIWLVCFLGYAWQVRRDAKAVDEAIAELRDVISELEILR